METTTLAVSYRGGEIEGVHRGAIAVVDPDGNLIYHLGDPDYRTFLRSSIKAIQALPVVRSGASSRFGFDDAELSICCASHTGAEYHLDTVSRMLEKMGLTVDALQCGTHWPEDRATRDRMIRDGGRPSALHNNCSGKHAGMLAACLAEGWPIENYLDLGHPLQQWILDLIANYAHVKRNTIGLATDGCSLPTFLTSLRSAATIAARFMRRSAPSFADEVTPDRCLLRAMNAHPEMVHAEGGYDTELMRALGGKSLAKRGAMGIMLVGVQTEKHGPIGIAVKMESGDSKQLPVVVTHLLRHLGVLSDTEIETLVPFEHISLDNWNGIHVGETKAGF